MKGPIIDRAATRAFVQYPYVARGVPARLPALRFGMEDRSHAVVIVGAGIVGLATALALARHGVPSVVIEADDSVCAGSRAICLSRRSLEILTRYGAEKRFLATGLPWVGGRSFYRNEEVLRFCMPDDENQRLPPMINIQQYYMEDFLLEAAESTGLVQVRWQSRVSTVHACPSGVRLSIDTPLGSYQLDTEWVVGCDGARSCVREAAGLRLQGTSYEGRYVIVDVALDSTRETERLAWFDPPSNPGSTILMHRQPDDVWRIDYQLRDEEDPEAAVLPRNVIPRIENHLRMIGEREDWAPIWVSLYRANALTLDTYRAGRLLLAGDAAHLVPIFGVRGANSGFEDADNLAWKLARVIRGTAHENLLDSYSIERVQAARENLRQGMKSTEFMSPPSFGFELMRTAVLGLAARHTFVRSLINPRQTQPIRYDSPLSLSDATSWDAGPQPGSVALECPVTFCGGQTPRQGYFTELLAPTFTAICFTEDGSLPAALAALESPAAGAEPMRTLRIATRQPRECASRELAWDHTSRLATLYGAAPGSVYLFRPDGHVLARWQEPSVQEIRLALQHALGAAACETGSRAHD
ncbi:MAG TPA: FAD-dependent oxidoreductase [Steroidobacteraceae bacterium]|nr:FAD-dependent oxidoreductase [Steroidobacteraceae bacterium]